jgi:hypothetical protein
MKYSYYLSNRVFLSEEQILGLTRIEIPVPTGIEIPVPTGIEIPMPTGIEMPALTLIETVQPLRMVEIVISQGLPPEMAIPLFLRIEALNRGTMEALNSGGIEALNNEAVFFVLTGPFL